MTLSAGTDRKLNESRIHSPDRACTVQIVVPRVSAVGFLCLALLACTAQTEETTTTERHTTTTTWSTDDFKDVVDFCTRVGFGAEFCPGMARGARDDYGCTVEQAFLLLGESFQISERTDLDPMGQVEVVDEAASNLCDG